MSSTHVYRHIILENTDIQNIFYGHEGSDGLSYIIWFLGSYGKSRHDMKITMNFFVFIG